MGCCCEQGCVAGLAEENGVFSRLATSASYGGPCDTSPLRQWSYGGGECKATCLSSEVTQEMDRAALAVFGEEPLVFTCCFNFQAALHAAHAAAGFGAR